MTINNLLDKLTLNENAVITIVVYNQKERVANEYYFINNLFNIRKLKGLFGNCVVENIEIEQNYSLTIYTERNI